MLQVGFERLTVEAVAAQLGVRHSSLYKHVRSRDDLVVLAAEAIVEGLAAPAFDAPWLTLLEQEAWVIWDMLEHHPGLALEMVVQSAPPPAAIARGEAVEAALCAAGLTPEDATLAADVVYDLAFDVAIRSHHIRAHQPIPTGCPPIATGSPRSSPSLAGIATALGPDDHPRRRRG